MRILDLYGGAGGAAMGYFLACQDAGEEIEIVGVDIEPQPRYPFQFVQADVLEYPLNGFDFVHASPPCQGYSIMRNLPWLRDKDYPLLIEPTRERLIASGLPWVIENVMGAQRKAQMNVGWLCGQMFGIPVLRHRLFQTSFPWLQPAHMRHWGSVRNGRTLGSRARDIVTVEPDSLSGGLERNMRGKRTKGNGAQAPAANIGHAAGFELAKTAMGIDWMKREELTQAVPPVMTRYLFSQFLAGLRGS